MKSVIEKTRLNRQGGANRIARAIRVMFFMGLLIYIQQGSLNAQSPRQSTKPVTNPAVQPATGQNANAAKQVNTDKEPMHVPPLMQTAPEGKPHVDAPGPKPPVPHGPAPMPQNTAKPPR